MADVDRILHEIDFKVYYGKLIPDFSPNGRTEVSCLCPFHDDKSPSLSVNIETGLWHCFACGEGGNAVDFIMKRDGCDFKEALDRIKREHGPTDAPEAQPKKKPSQAKDPKFVSSHAIDLMHSQLMKNPEALQMLRERYGLDEEIIKAYRIGWQNEKILIPFEQGEDKWTWKEHKGVQSRGNKAILYPSHIHKENHSRVIIAEGELKALLLLQHGFHAVSGTAGSSTWRKEWSGCFRDRDVILAYDADEPGRAGALRAAHNLNGIARVVKTVVWPSEMNSPELKDVTDYFTKLHHTKEDFQRLVDGAQEIGDTIKEIGGIRFIEPPGFNIRPDGIWYKFETRDGINEKLIAHSPLFITARAIDVDTGNEEAELTFFRDGKRRKAWLSRRQLLDAKKLIEFADIGIPVNSSSARKMVEYSSAFEAKNIHLIPKSLISKGVGWKEVAGHTLFVLNSRLNSKSRKREDQGAAEDTVEFVPEPGFERFVKAFQPHGSLKKWVDTVTQTLRYDSARFALYASFAAPLLRPLKADNFIIDYWGQTSLGKTTVLELASSVWGNPHKESGGLIFSWDSTRVFLERMASFFCDVPIFPDDSQTVDNRTLERMLYMVANGGAKGRGDISGIRHTATWHTVCFSTGEISLVDNKRGGASARTISIDGSPFPNAGGQFINELKQNIREHYGHAGPKFIEYIAPLVDNEKSLSRMKDRLNMYQMAFSNHAKTEVGDRVSYYFSTVMLASEYVHNIFDFGDPEEAERAIYRVFNRVVTNSENEGDTATRAMETMAAWIFDHKSFFTDSNKDSYGTWNEGEYVGISPLKLKEALAENGFSSNGVLRAWGDRNWILRDPGHNTTTIRVQNDRGFSSDIRRLVVFPWNKFKEFM